MKGWWRHIAIVLLVLSYVEADAQGFSISGVLTGKAEDRPIEGAKVIVNETQQHTFSDANGRFVLEDILPGRYTLTTYKEGLASITQRFKIVDHPIRLDLTLAPITRQLQEVQIKSARESSFGISHLRAVEGSAIYAGKKTEVVHMDRVQGNLATNNGRQVYAKVAGLNIWESDGAGIQLGIGGRGLNPSRVSNFNTRQNGYDISADALGYPESYYTPPSEALDRIEVVRGAASLQYGTQFGGFINFRLKQGPVDKPLEVTSRQTIGSFGLYNSFNSIGGSHGKWRYYGFYQYKTGDGWRPNSAFDQHTAFTSVQWQASERLSLQGEYTYMSYLAQQAGGLTDAMFAEDPTQSIRGRNWFRVNWNLFALKARYQLGPKTHLSSNTFALLAGRDALGFLGRISRTDPLTDRDLLRDEYRNIGNETRFMHKYTLGGNIATALVGIRYYKGHTHRRQGWSTDGADAHFDYLDQPQALHSAYTFPSENVAVFAEHVVALNPKLTFTPGVRWELIHTESDGFYNTVNRDLAGNTLSELRTEEQRSSRRTFLIAGIGTEYKLTQKLSAYGNWSQNYRSINFNDMRVINPNVQVDPNLQDERGFSADLGLRGQLGDGWRFDVGGFLIHYNDRIGEVLKTDSIRFTPFRYRTNISQSINVGLETLIEWDVLGWATQGSATDRLVAFVNGSWMRARYVSSEESAFDGNEVELVPAFNIKTGVSYESSAFRASYQLTYLSEQFSDATNADFDPHAVSGIIPSYAVMDLSLGYSYKYYHISGGINNMLDRSYFTRRASGYPGPGIIPAEPRTFYLTLQVKV